MTCKHEAFESRVAVARFSDTNGFMAEITVTCQQCHKPFMFLGLDPGLDLQGAKVNIDGTEARIAICPVGERLNPLQLAGFNVHGTKGTA